MGRVLQGLSYDTLQRIRFAGAPLGGKRFNQCSGFFDDLVLVGGLSLNTFVATQRQQRNSRLQKRLTWTLASPWALRRANRVLEPKPSHQLCANETCSTRTHNGLK